MQNSKPEDLLLDSYDFHLPEHLIADRPVSGRHHSKLLVFNAKTNEVMHKSFIDLPELLSEDHHLVLNQSKVFPCRLIGQKPSGGKCEVFLLSLIVSLR